MFEEKQYKALRAALHIDTMRLEQELIEHPARLQTIMEFAADALQLRDTAKAAYDIATADAAQHLRENANEKFSEARIASLLPMVKSVQEASAVLDDAKHDLAYWQGLADATREKGGSLKRIAELTIAGYLAPNTAYQRQREELNERRRPIIKKTE